MDPCHCSKCGMELRESVSPVGLCPKCLLELGFQGQSDRLGDADPGAGKPVRDSSLKSGQHFGPYQIVRQLGTGGMGEVYEAEHLESGRLVALKVLGYRLTSEKDRKRFLREGRLAASLSHPHSTYIYGTEEIEGLPSIAMELTPGGTLEDRVKRKGALPPNEAVDLTLQVIEGLEAASAQGILHRDVKPSNCFVDSEGTAKIGDFGLSISTVARVERALTTTGAILGTPVFASPEQLHGESLDVRTDIYSVGATLYFLLTGETPFKGDNNVQLLTKVLDTKPVSPTRLRAEVPKELSQVVLRCMQKERSKRFDNYRALRRALLPFSSNVASVADLGSRYVAGAVDFAFLFLIWVLLFSTASDLWQSLWGANLFLGFALLLVYFGVPEGLWGASVGKALCGLRVIGPEGGDPGLARSLLRSLIFILTIWIVYFILMGLLELAYPVLTSEMTSSEGRGGWPSVIGGGLIALALLLLMPMILFLSASAGNGLAGVHELGSKTRVVNRAPRRARVAFESGQEVFRALSADGERLGPYWILARLEEGATGDLLLGYDDKLKRRVWIRELPAESEAVTTVRRDLSRPTRLHWLGGKRSTDDCWDAYEAPEGRAFLDLVGQSHPWAVVRQWLLQLAQELEAGSQERTLPSCLGLQNLWITSVGQLKVVDFPVPRVKRQPDSELPRFPVTDVERFRDFIAALAVAALEGVIPPDKRQRERSPQCPLPLHAASFFRNLRHESFDKTVQNLALLIRTESAVTRSWRLAHLACCSLLILLPTASAILMQVPSQRDPDIEPLRLSLLRYEELRNLGSEESLEELMALEVYIAGRFGETITNREVWFSSPAHLAIRESLRTLAEQIYKRHPRPSAREMQGATQTLKPFLQSVERQTDWPRQSLVLALWGLSFAAIVGCLSGLLARGGIILKLLGIALVSRTGSRATWPRSLYRTLLAWAPGLLCIALLPLLPWTGEMHRIIDERWVSVLVLGLAGATFLAGGVSALISPGRGLPDRIAGTYLVPV